MRRKEMQKLLDERAERIDLLDRRIEAMEQLVDSYKKREQSVVDAMSSLRESADRYKQENEEKARELISTAQERARTVLSDAQLRARTMVEEAEEKASGLLKSARERSARLLTQAEASVAEYETLLAAYNETLEKNASEAAESAERFAQYMRGRKMPKSTLGEEVSGLSSLPYAQEVRLPNPADDPVQLMRNIYKLQNRDIPQPRRQPAQPYTPARSKDDAPQAEPGGSAEFWASFTPRAEPEQQPAPAQEAAPAPEASVVFYAPAAAPEASAPEPKPEDEPAVNKASEPEPQAEPVVGFDWEAVKQRYGAQPRPASNGSESVPDFDWDAALRDLDSGAYAASEPARQQPEQPPAEPAPRQPEPEPQTAPECGWTEPPARAPGAGRYASAQPAPDVQRDVQIQHIPRHAAQEEPRLEQSAPAYRPQPEKGPSVGISWGEIMPDLDAPMPPRERLSADAAEPVPTVRQFVATDPREEEISLDALLDEIIRAGEKKRE